MALGVQRQVVGAREAALAVAAAERLGAGVLAVVPRQLVRPGEAPLAALPGALVRLLAWNQPQTPISHIIITPTCYIL